MSQERDSYELPKEGWKDLTHDILKIGATSLLGPFAALVWEKYIQKPHQKKMEVVLEDILVFLKHREQNTGESVETVFQSERFQCMFSKCLQAVSLETNEKKLEYLKNSLFNSLTHESIEKDTVLTIMSSVEALTASHIQILKFWHSPDEWIESRGKKREYDNVVPGYGHVFEKYCPGFAGQKTTNQKFHLDLHNSGLMEKIIFSNAEDSWHESKTTGFGKLFLEFITETDTTISERDEQ